MLNNFEYRVTALVSAYLYFTLLNEIKYCPMVISIRYRVDKSHVCNLVRTKYDPNHGHISRPLN